MSFILWFIFGMLFLLVSMHSGLPACEFSEFFMFELKLSCVVCFVVCLSHMLLWVCFNALWITRKWVKLVVHFSAETVMYLLFCGLSLPRSFFLFQLIVDYKHVSRVNCSLFRCNCPLLLSLILVFVFTMLFFRVSIYCGLLGGEQKLSCHVYCEMYMSLPCSFWSIQYTMGY